MLQNTTYGGILDDEQDPLTLISRFDCRVDLIRRRRREDLASDGRGQHAQADETGVQRFMAAAPARDHAHFGRVVSGECLIVPDNRRGFRNLTDILGITGHHAGNHFRHEVTWIVQYFFQENLTPLSTYISIISQHPLAREPAKWDLPNSIDS